MQHLLFKTKVASTGVTLELLNQSDFENNFKAINDFLPDMSLMKFTYNLSALLKFPIETVFVSTNEEETPNGYDFVSENHTHITSAKAMYLNENVFVNTVAPSECATADEITYLFSTLIHTAEDKEAAIKHVKALADGFGAYDYVIDIEAIINPPAPKVEDVSSGKASIRDFIATSYPIPKEKETGFHIDPDIWFLIIRNIIRKENTLIVGPTGSGKTELVSHIAKAMGLNLSITDMGTVQDAQSALLGVHRLNKDSASVFDYAPFAINVQNAGINLLDEINRAPLAANNILFPCLDSRRYLPVDIADAESARHIPIHEDAVFIATANLGSEYAGTHDLDRALLDRFLPIELDYPSEKDEINILAYRTGIDKKSAQALVKVSNNIRKQFKDQELSNAISVRHTLQMASLVKDGFAIEKAMTSTILPLFEDSVGASERNKVRSIIAAF